MIKSSMGPRPVENSKRLSLADREPTQTLTGRGPMLPGERLSTALEEMDAIVGILNGDSLGE
jgi:hypothetical protein